MKKIIIGLLSIFTIATTSAGLSAVLPVAHAEGKACPTCGKSEHYNYQYTKKEATCTEAGIEDWFCSDTACGAHINETIPAKGHTWGEWQTTTAPTCTALGAKVRECSVCNEHETENIPALGHDFTKTGIKGRGENVAEGNVYDCTSELVCYYLCSRCDAIGTETYVHREAGSHTWGEWETTTAATCTTAGEKTRTCTVCPETETETIPATGAHSWGEWIISQQPDGCDADGMRYRVCSVCKEEDVQMFTSPPHQYGNPVYIPATCTSLAQNKYTCSVCGNVYTESLGGHLADHKYTVIRHIAATCTSSGTHIEECSVCKNVLNSTLPATGHSWGEWTTTTAATCTAQGVKTRTCTNCNETETQSIQSLGHDYTKQAIKGRGENVVSGNINDCTSEVVAYHLCSRCDAIGTTTFVYREAGSHVWSEWQTTTEATCTTDGEKTRNCTNCAESETQTITHPGHAWSEWNTTAATCETDGSKTRTCTVCSKTDTQTILHPGHTWSAWQTNTEATCETDGSKTRTCSVCSKSDTQPITHPGHLYGDKVNVLASCTLGAGWKQTCSVCGDVHFYNGDSDPLGHTWGEWQITTAATCEKNGAKVRECSRCNNHETQTILALGHDYSKRAIKGRGDNIVSGDIHDCTTQVVAYILCSRCDAVGTTTFVYREAGSHVFGEWQTTTAATCKTDGSKTRTCTVCPHTETQTIPATGAHTWGEWQTTPSATCTANGAKVRTCTGCHTREQTIIPAIGHDFSKRGDTLSDIVSGDIHNCATPVIMAFRCSRCDASGVNTSYTYVYREAGAHKAKKYYHAPTCTESGSSGEECENCGKDLKSDYLPPLGHDFNADRVCSRCGLEADYIIKFFDHDGKKIDETTAKKGEAIDFPHTNPTRRGYSFAGWFYYNESGDYVKVDRYQTVKADMEIYAYYEAIYINVYITDSVTDKTTTYKVLDSYTLGESLKPVEHNGYKFLGYTRDGANIDFSTDTPITEEYHLTANYEITTWGQILDFFQSLSIWTIVIIVIAVAVLVIVLRSNNGGNQRRRRR